MGSLRRSSQGHGRFREEKGEPEERVSVQPGFQELETGTVALSGKWTG